MVLPCHTTRISRHLLQGTQLIFVELVCGFIYPTAESTLTMSANTTNTDTDASEDTNPTVVETIDDAGFDTPHTIIADTSTDNAWIATPSEQSCPLDDWE